MLLTRHGIDRRMQPQMIGAMGAGFFGNALDDALVGLYTFAGGVPRNLCRQLPVNVVPVHSVHRFGVAGANFASAANSPDPALNFTTGAWTVAALIEVVNFSAVSIGATAWDYTAYATEFSNAGWSLRGSVTNSSFAFLTFNNNSVTSYELVGTTSRSDGTHLLVGTTDGTTRSIYIDGRREATTTNNPAAASTATASFANVTNVGATEQHRLYMGYAWQRCLSPNDVRLLAQSPFGQARSLARLVVKAPAAGTGGGPLIFGGALLNGGSLVRGRLVA